jgi:hypothetical protein
VDTRLAVSRATFSVRVLAVTGHVMMAIAVSLPGVTARPRSGGARLMTTIFPSWQKV